MDYESLEEVFFALVESDGWNWYASYEGGEGEENGHDSPDDVICAKVPITYPGSQGYAYAFLEKLDRSPFLGLSLLTAIQVTEEGRNSVLALLNEENSNSPFSFELRDDGWFSISYHLIFEGFSEEALFGCVQELVGLFIEALQEELFPKLFEIPGVAVCEEEEDREEFNAQSPTANNLLI